jgi:hypothetical protein
MKRLGDYVRFHADMAWLVAFCLLAGAGGLFIAFLAIGDSADARASQQVITEVRTRNGQTQTIVTRRRITETATIRSVGTVVGTHTVYGQAQTIRVEGPGGTVVVQGPVRTVTRTQIEKQVTTVTVTVAKKPPPTKTVTVVETVTVPQTVTVTETGP